MLGLMNNNCDSTVEFYASAHRSSLYKRKPSKDSRTYTSDGRVLINGVLEVQDPPDKLWRSLIYRAITGEMMTDITQKPEGPLAIIRRVSSRGGMTTSNVKTTTNESTNGDEKKKNVTMVRVKTLRRIQSQLETEKKVRDDEDDMNNDDNDKDNDSDVVDDDDDEEVRIYAEEAVLKRLMEEKAMFESEMGEISMELATGEHPEVIDEENDIVVERF